MAKNCDSEMSVGSVSGGFAWMNAEEYNICKPVFTQLPYLGYSLTFRPQVLDPLQVVHLLQSIRFLPRQRLLIIIFAGPADPV